MDALISSVNGTIGAVASARRVRLPDAFDPFTAREAKWPPSVPSPSWARAVTSTQRCGLMQ